MNIELVVIGNEILSGSTVNTNAAFIGKNLFESGYKLTRQTVLPDDEQQLKEGIQEALSQNDLVITTGGLGPTIDDISLDVIANLFEGEGETLPNPLGTAPGYIFRNEKGTVVMVPGVPHEMETMIVEQVLPYIKNRFPLKKRPYRKTIYLTQITEIKVDPIIRGKTSYH